MLRFGGGYQGSSFSELLQTEFPHLRPDFSRLGPGESGVGIPHGTTVLAMKYGDGVLVAGDRLATEGYRVASRDVQKVYPTDDFSLIAIAGAAVFGWYGREQGYFKQGLLFGGLIGLVAGLLLTGIFIMIYRGLRHLMGRHD